MTAPRVVRALRPDDAAERARLQRLGVRFLVDHTGHITVVAPPEVCKKCAEKYYAPARIDRHETFTWRFHDGLAYLFDITVARQIVARRIREGAPPPLERAPLDVIRTGLNVEPEHVPHVDVDEPGLGVSIDWRGTSCGILIDGQHRAARRLELGHTDIAIYVLNDGDRDAITLRRWRD